MGKEKKTEIKKIYSDDGVLVYEGETVNGKPYGNGIEYYDNGNKHREGKFYIKGLISGTEYYPNGNIRFRGDYSLNRGYGPNFPREGIFCDENGTVIYEGKPKIRCSGLGYPFIIEPSEFGKVDKYGSKCNYYMWEDMIS